MLSHHFKNSLTDITYLCFYLYIYIYYVIYNMALSKFAAVKENSLITK